MLVREAQTRITKIKPKLKNVVEDLMCPSKLSNHTSNTMLYD